MGRDTALCLGYHYIKYAEQNPLFLTVFSQTGADKAFYPPNDSRMGYSICIVPSKDIRYPTKFL